MKSYDYYLNEADDYDQMPRDLDPNEFEYMPNSFFGIIPIKADTRVTEAIRDIIITEAINYTNIMDLFDDECCKYIDFEYPVEYDDIEDVLFYVGSNENVKQLMNKYKDDKYYFAFSERHKSLYVIDSKKMQDALDYFRSIIYPSEEQQFLNTGTCY